MTYHAGFGPGIMSGHPGRDPFFECDGCGSQREIYTTRGIPQWMLDGKPPPRWKHLRMHDGARSWHLCRECWKGPEAR